LSKFEDDCLDFKIADLFLFWFLAFSLDFFPLLSLWDFKSEFRVVVLGLNLFLRLQAGIEEGTKARPLAHCFSSSDPDSGT
jgi:hypothetical protein